MIGQINNNIYNIILKCKKSKFVQKIPQLYRLKHIFNQVILKIVYELSLKIINKNNI